MRRSTKIGKKHSYSYKKISLQRSWYLRDVCAISWNVAGTAIDLSTTHPQNPRLPVYQRTVQAWVPIYRPTAQTWLLQAVLRNLRFQRATQVLLAVLGALRVQRRHPRKNSVSANRALSQTLL